MMITLTQSPRLVTVSFRFPVTVIALPRLPAVIWGQFTLSHIR